MELFVTVYEGQTNFGEHIAIVGEGPALGDWKRPIPLEPSDYPTWRGSVVLTSQQKPIEFKLVKVLASGELKWEPGMNRMMYIQGQGPLFYEGTWAG